MDLGFSEEQLMLRDTVRKLCAAAAPLSTLRTCEGREPGFSRAFWDELLGMGLTGIAIDPQQGGLGMGALDVAIVMAEFGRALAVSPFYDSALLAARLIKLAGTVAQRERWLDAIAQGRAIVTVASAEPGRGQGATGIGLTARLEGADYVLTGSKHLVPFVASADGVIVLAREAVDGGAVLALLLERAQLSGAGLASRYQTNHAGDALYRMDFDGLRVPATQALAGARDAGEAWEAALTASMIPLAAYAVGAAERVHEISIDYAKYRRAFGRAIGGFQAIAHDLAEVTVAIDGARTLVHQAAWFCDRERSYAQLARMAKLQACDTFCRAAALSIQVHGGIGYTTEADPQLYFRRAKHLEQTGFGPAALEHRIAAHLFDDVAASTSRKATPQVVEAPAEASQ